tara:strand:- start:918 stop:1046 length:129 start_codon:yes stop_codon:yes gene_type:complete
VQEDTVAFFGQSITQITDAFEIATAPWGENDPGTFFSDDFVV